MWLTKVSLSFLTQPNLHSALESLLMASQSTETLPVGALLYGELTGQELQFIVEALERMPGRPSQTFIMPLALLAATSSGDRTSLEDNEKDELPF